MTGSAAVLALVVASLLGAPGSSGSGVATQDALDASARSVAELWERGDVQGLAGMLRATGVALDLGDRSHASLPVRQAAAAIRDLLARHTSRSVRLTRVTGVVGTPSRAYVELGWETVPEGTAEVIGHTIFVGLEQADGRWWITELRVLR